MEEQNKQGNEPEIQAIEQYLKSVQVEQPSAAFTQRVMINLHRTARIATGLPARKNMLMLAGLFVALGVALLLAAAGTFEQVTSITLNSTLIPNEKIREQIPSIPFNGRLVFHVVALLNLALAFILLDRVVLKPWFTRREKMNYQQF